MSAFSCFNILKSNSKSLARAQGIKLHEAQELIAKQAKFTDFHDLTTVARRDPMECRLMTAALGGVDLGDALYEEPAYAELHNSLEDMLAGLIADTNASDFTMENIEVSGTRYDDSTGVLTLEVSFTYQGELDPDRAYTASEFYMDALFRLKRRDGQWSLAEDGIEILSSESDQDLDWAEQMATDAQVFNPSNEYDLYDETDYSAEEGATPAQQVQPLYRLRDRSFLHMSEMNPDGSWGSIAGMVVLNGASEAGEYRVVAGDTLLGVIRGNYYLRGDGARFRLVEVWP
ncbi:hypothetical protein [Pseudomonas aeruginosa]|uniref:hypothetical protein n=1 Tax=Pseudomonas aeruginosa TaxID=287 RepID=UPI0023B2DFC9|nr:hypothetical protein [Pseudomonas aeruginosa]MDE9749665.1 hypothetical protein [Pseudomonas aeruginosa]